MEVWACDSTCLDAFRHPQTLARLRLPRNVVAGEALTGPLQAAGQGYHGCFAHVYSRWGYFAVAWVGEGCKMACFVVEMLVDG